MRRHGEDVPEDKVPEDYRGVYVGGSGVWVDRKHVATLAEIEAKRGALTAAIDADATLLPTVGYSGLVAALDLHAEPAAQAISALRLFVGRETYFTRPHRDPDIPPLRISPMCSPRFTDQPGPDSEVITLSIFLDEARAWVGLSRVNEFQEIGDVDHHRDLDKLRVTLREHKASATFADRTDVELAASAGTAADVIAVVDYACGEGFRDIALLAPDKLTARPSL